MVKVPTWGLWYWPVWLVVMLTTLAIPEFYALFTNTQNTQSAWVWRELDVTTDTPKPWTAVHYLFFGLWLVIMSWLTFHYFWRKFT